MLCVTVLSRVSLGVSSFKSIGLRLPLELRVAYMIQCQQPTKVTRPIEQISYPRFSTTNGGGLGGGGGVLILRMAVVLQPSTLASILCRDGARRVFANQALLAPSAKRREVFGESHEE